MADDALVRTICECVLNVLKGTVLVSKPAKKKLLTHMKSLISLAEKSTPLDKNEKEIVGTTRRNFFKCFATFRSPCVKFDSYLK